MLRLCAVAGKIRVHLAAHSSVAELRMQADAGWLPLDIVP